VCVCERARVRVRVTGRVAGRESASLRVHVRARESAACESDWKKRVRERLGVLAEECVGASESAACVFV
jgi:hypothetical protein